MILALAGCSEAEPPAHLRIAGGDAELGRRLIQAYECGSCHRIDGVPGARGAVGPPLTDYAQRTLLAGIVPNVPRNLVPWLIDPAGFDPRTAMPNVGVTEPEARHIATYLYTLGAAGVRIYPSEPLPLSGLLEASRPSDDRRLRGPIPIEEAMERLADTAGAKQ